MRLVQSLHAFRCDADHGRGDRSPPLGRVDRPCLRSRKESPYCLTTKASLAASKLHSTASLHRASRQRYGRLDELDGPPYLQSGMVGYIALREMMAFVHGSMQWRYRRVIRTFPAPERTGLARLRQGVMWRLRCAWHESQDFGVCFWEVRASKYRYRWHEGIQLEVGEGGLLRVSVAC